jgi:hypothetical protein
MTRYRSSAFALSLVMAFVVTVASGAAQSVHAAELLMYELQGCPWCKLWRAEIGPAYPQSAEGLRAPLRVVDLRGPPPEGITLEKPVRTSPTFVLVEGGREVGRITGYPGADFFWPLLNELLAKLDPKPAIPPAAAPGQRSL